jgi:membrane protein
MQLRDFWPLLRRAGARFWADDTFQEGAALAYYAIFSLPALIVLLTRGIGAVFGADAVSGALYEQIRQVLGPEGAADVQSMVAKASTDEGLTVAAVIGFVTLLIAGTGVFVSMQETLNAIWGVRARPAKAWLKVIIDRARGLGLILTAGLLLLIGVVVQTLLVGLGSWLDRLLPGAELVWLQIANHVTSVLLGTLLFGSLFKFLPDAQVRWRDVWVGALVTSALFSIGRSLIGLYLGHSNMGSVYGAAGTVIVLLAWVFYSSQILFFGAVFTRCYAEEFGVGIEPAPHAVRVQVVEVSQGEVRVKHESTPDGQDAAARQAAKALAETAK